MIQERKRNASCSMNCTFLEWMIICETVFMDKVHEVGKGACGLRFS